jgi:hypothetical protein
VALVLLWGLSIASDFAQAAFQRDNSLSTISRFFSSYAYRQEPSPRISRKPSSDIVAMITGMTTLFVLAIIPVLTGNGSSARETSS